MNACEDLQGSYECFCDREEDEEGTCHKFWCTHYEVEGNNKKKTVEDVLRAFKPQKKKSIERNKNENAEGSRLATAGAAACCLQNPAFDVKMESVYECLCKSKSLTVNSRSCTDSCKNEEIDIEEPKNSSRTGANSNFLDPIVQKSRPELFGRQSKSGNKSESPITNVTEDLCSCACDFEKSSPANSQSSSSSPVLKESNRSIGTAITPRQTMDENIIPLLKSIFDVLQTMRDEKLHLGPMASRNVDIHLDEPFNQLPPPPQPLSLRVPPSSPKFLKKFEEMSCDSQSCSFNSLKCQNFINSQDNLAILEPAERDLENFESNYQEPSPASQRLIPVDMDLLRTDEELIWEPDSNFNKLEDEEREGMPGMKGCPKQREDRAFLTAQFRQFSHETLSQSPEDLITCGGGSCRRDNLKNLNNSQEAVLLSRMKRSPSMEADDDSCECICGGPEDCAEDCCRRPSNVNDGSESQMIYKNDGNEENLVKIEFSQAVQVNLSSFQNLTSRSAQFLTFDRQLEDLSGDEKHLKTSEMNTSKEEIQDSKVDPQTNSTIKLDVGTCPESQSNSRTKLDVGTDCPDFDNDLGTDCTSLGDEIKSSHRSQEEQAFKPQNQEMNQSQFIESILFDLKVMDSFRKNNPHNWQSFARLPCASTGGWERPSKDLSYPVTIETVQELGANSLFIKWRVQNIGNIGGYEIFLDGHLTNRYFNCIHRAAVICDVNLQCPHRITLRAQPLLLPSQTRTSLLTTNSCSSYTSTSNTTSNHTHPEPSCPQPDGSVWYPSVYHFEPNSFSAPINAVLY